MAFGVVLAGVGGVCGSGRSRFGGLSCLAGGQPAFRLRESSGHGKSRRRPADRKKVLSYDSITVNVSIRKTGEWLTYTIEGAAEVSRKSLKSSMGSAYYMHRVDDG